MVQKLEKPVDIVINNAGYFYGPQELVLEDTLNFDEELKQIDICAVGPLRVNSALINAGKLTPGAKIIIITSQVRRRRLPGPPVAESPGTAHLMPGYPHNPTLLR
eukprot:scaffold245_cov34-Tisochrysis_lutea.AAC.1